MQKVIRSSAFILIMCLMAAIMVVPAMAADEIGFSVSPILPENQVQGTKGYFDLRVQPGQTQDLTLTVFNRSNENIVVSVEAFTASTNLNGIIDYTNPDGVLDATIPYSFADLTEIEEELVTIPAGSSKNVTVTVTLPDKSYDGHLLGGLQIKKELTEAELESDSMIVNQYSYVIAVKLTETDAVIAPDFELGEIQAELVNGRASIVNNIRNTQPALVKDIDTTVEIYPKGSDTPIMTREMQGTNMAPNSIFPFTLTDSAGYGVKAGTYISKITMEFNGQTWNFEQEFTIEAEQAAVINNNAVNIGTQQTALSEGLPTWVVIAGIAGAVVLVVIIVVLVIIMKKMNAMKKGQTNIEEPQK